MHKAIVLAAGRGKRMGSLTDNQPKCMVPLLKKPLFLWVLESLHAAGCEDIAVVTGYQHHSFDTYKFKQFFNPRWLETNMVRSLLEASTWLEQFSCIISYSDIFYSPNTIRALIECDTSLVISYDPFWRNQWEARFENPLSDAETFQVNASGHLIEIGQKTSQIEEIQGQYMGLLKITPQGWTTIKNKLASLTEKETDRIDMTSLLRLLIEDGVSIKAVPCKGIWGEVDSVSDLIFFNGLLKSAHQTA